MTISDLGSLGEFVGSIAVVVTLIYLTTQLRQNTRAIRAAATQALDKSITDNIALWASSRETAVLMERGLEAYESLSEEESIHFHTLISVFFLSMDSNFWSHRNSLIPDELWERENAVIRAWVNTPGGRIAWERKRSQVSRPFREYVESRLLGDT